MEIILLGTGAATPTLHRWPASIAVQSDGEILLFDCGEGVQVQFLKAKLKPGKLSRIFISHFHGDHFNGLIGLLTSLQLGGRKKILHLHGPVGLADYLQYMQVLAHFRFDYPLNLVEINADVEQTVWDLGKYSITAKPLCHRIFSLGFRVEQKPLPGKFNAESAERLGIPSGPLRSRLQNGDAIELADGKQIEPSQVMGPPRPGKKIAICQDTSPCKNAVELARGVDVLIHEGTFDRSQADRALETGHSTVSQAAQVAKDAGVKRLVLTHISSRYRQEDEEALLEHAGSIFPNTTIGKDLMKIKVESTPKK